MPKSGIEVDPDAVQLFNAIKKDKVNKFAVFKITDDNTKVICHVVGDAKKTTTMDEDEVEWNKMKSLLKKEEPYFCVYDFRFTKSSGAICEKIAFVTWCDEDCPIKKKMTFASTKDEVKKRFQGIYHTINANEISELDYQTHAKEIEKKTEK